MDVAAAGALQRLLGERGAAPRRSIMPKRVGGLETTMLSATDQLGDQRQLLEDADDAGGVGGGRIGEAHLAAVEQHAALVGRHDARHDLDEGGFAGAVLAEDGVDACRLRR